MDAGIILFDYSTTDTTLLPRDAGIILFDYSTTDTTLLPRDAGIITFDYTITANPGKIRVWNGISWVAQDRYVWNGTNWVVV